MTGPMTCTRCGQVIALADGDRWKYVTIETARPAGESQREIVLALCPACVEVPVFYWSIPG